ncbi:hypothetical protein DC083_00490 [Ignatzschineria ureiclastica]|uniref:Bacterial type II secretion system protein E domain-containing protein n=1 Tax=Ignatzschineria ureiclastica TaxID=472582 RepID=A0A2U2AGE3_9GAMM|nr:ATPase, T2SS/T4P/T4SS family [Ignatzschineria ureiclastica]PWD81710.1 hypothetical protein DC083_00490 [Ignatzschineria ureiclastica]GGZ90062.1 hypothetical protein GCM10007162_00950 [Ignatzschineria ureiclastica]
MKLEEHQLIQALIALKWISKEAIPLLSAKMYENEKSVVGKLRAHGLSSDAIFEGAMFANINAKHSLLVVDLACLNLAQVIAIGTPLTVSQMNDYFIAPIGMIDGRLKIAVADIETVALLKQIHFPAPVDYWLADSQQIQILIAQIAGMRERAEKAETAVKAKEAKERAEQEQEALKEREREAREASAKAQLLQAQTNQERQSAEANEGHESIDQNNADRDRMEKAENSRVVDAIEENHFDENPREDSRGENVVESDSIKGDSIEDDLAEDNSDGTDRVIEAYHDEDYRQDTEEVVLPVDDDYLAEIDAQADQYRMVDEDDQDNGARELSYQYADADEDSISQARVMTEGVVISEATVSTLEELETEELEAEELESEEQAVDNDSLIELDVDLTENDGHLEFDRLNSKVSVTNSPSMALKSDLPGELTSDDLVGYLNFVLLDAVTQKASDIHFEPYESHYRIRFRIDGLLQEAYQVPEKYRERIASRLKVMAELDIAEKRLPQDGHLTIQLDEDDANGESVDARISVIPTIWGEKVVLRLLDSNEVALTLNQLGLSNHDRQVIQAAIERSQGLILVTGPTGSGKTVTLYAALNVLNQASRNIATIEDPVEINLEGINQLQIHPEIGLDFAEALRAFLRQDPDVVMVGEIRDYKTADIVVKAAQTGHLVLSTLHTNSAIETLNRLKNMGIELYNIASTVKLIIAQRLVRTLCHCKEEDIVDSHYLESLGFTPKQAASRFFRAKGCSECRDGYKGRRAIFEVMSISKRMEALILEDAGTIEVQRQAEREGIKTLRQAGIEMVLEGVTSLEEVLRVTHD